MHLSTAKFCLTCRQTSRTDKVHQGDGVWQFAVRNKVDFGAVMRANGFSGDPVLQPGQKLVICGQTSRTDRVHQGEGVWQFAVRNKLDFGAVMRANGFSGDPVQQPGQELVLP